MMIGQKHSFDQRKRQGVLIGWNRIRQVSLNICAIHGFPTPILRLLPILIPRVDRENVLPVVTTLGCVVQMSAPYTGISSLARKSLCNQRLFSRFSRLCGGCGNRSVALW